MNQNRQGNLPLPLFTTMGMRGSHTTEAAGMGSPSPAPSDRIQACLIGSLMDQKWFVNLSHLGPGNTDPCPHLTGESLHVGADPSAGCGGIPHNPERPNLSSEAEDRPPCRPPFVFPSFPSSPAFSSTADGDCHLSHHVPSYHCHGAARSV